MLAPAKRGHFLFTDAMKVLPVLLMAFEDKLNRFTNFIKYNAVAKSLHNQLLYVPLRTHKNPFPKN
jgi:hypothetical protein